MPRENDNPELVQASLAFHLLVSWWGTVSTPRKPTLFSGRVLDRGSSRVDSLLFPLCTWNQCTTQDRTALLLSCASCTGIRCFVPKAAISLGLGAARTSAWCA